MYVVDRPCMAITKTKILQTIIYGTRNQGVSQCGYVRLSLGEACSRPRRMKPDPVGTYSLVFLVNDGA